MNIPENFDRWMFDYKEGNLSAAEMDAFEKFLVQNPDFEVEADAWSNAFIPNETFTYPNADALQKDNRFAAGWLGWSAAAAVVLLLIGSTFLLNTNTSITEVNISQFSEVNTNANSNTQNSSSNQLIADSKDAMDINNYNYHIFNDGALANSLLNNNNSNSANQSGVNQNNPNNLHGNGGASNPVVNQNGLNPLGEFTEVNELNPNAINAGAMADELNKFSEDGFGAAYSSNPALQELGFDVAKRGSYDFGSWQNKLKRFWNKVEDAFDVPPTNLTNLRDPDILIPNSNVLSFNPGFAGGLTTPRFELNYRNQWFGTEQNSQNMTMSFDSYVRKIKGGIGVVVNMKDFQHGQYNDYNFSLIYSPKILFGKNVLFEPALKATLGVLNANGSKLAADSQFELERGRTLETPAEPQMSGHQNHFYKDFGAGFMINADKFYAGFSVDNLNRHFENVYNKEGYATPTSTPLLINGIIGFDFENDPVNGKKTFSASPFAAYQQYANRQEIWAGVNLRLGFFTVGGSMSHKQDFTASAGFKFEKFKVIYQYDHTYSTLMDSQVGSHNIGIRFNGAIKK
jgi:type IX secretion system PorP/SprF family membrane protein